MEDFDRFKRGKKKPQQPSGVSQEQPIETVPLGYKPQSSSRLNTELFATKDALQAHLRKTFKFISHIIEGILVVAIDKKASGFTYEVYYSHSRMTALEFLRAIPLTEIPEL